jgi:4-oxalocrotonate tautomerase
MIQKVTDAVVSVEGENMRPVTWILIEEVSSGDWGIRGKCMTGADVKELAAGKSG